MLSPALIVSLNCLLAALERLDDPEREDQEGRGKYGDRVQADAGGQPDRQRGQHDAGVLRVFNLGSIAHQVGRADDAEGARQTGADDQHDDGADDRQDDLGLDHRRLPRRRALALGAQRQCRAERGGQRQTDQGLLEFRLVELG